MVGLISSWHSLYHYDVMTARLRELLGFLKAVAGEGAKWRG